MSILDLTGKQVQKPPSPERKLSVNALPGGTYVFLLEHKDGKASALKFVKA